MKNAIFSFALLIGINASTQAQNKITTRDLQQLYKMMSGSFSSEVQSRADTSYFDIRLHMKPIWKEKKGEKWLYVEQAMNVSLDKPYRQRVYRLAVLDDSTISSEVYNFKADALKYAGEWHKKKPLAGVTMDLLEARQGCIIYMHKTGKKIYDGGTHANDCTSSLRGASYATSEAHIQPSGMVTWDRGYDKDAKQVWGAKKGGYDFKKKEQY